MNKTRISKKTVKIHRQNLKNGFTEDAYVKEKIIDKNKTIRDFYVPVVRLLNDMLDKNCKTQE